MCGCDCAVAERQCAVVTVRWLSDKSVVVTVRWLSAVRVRGSALVDAPLWIIVGALARDERHAAERAVRSRSALLAVGSAAWRRA